MLDGSRISPEERALIDAAIAEGRVTTVPAGACGLDISGNPVDGTSTQKKWRRGRRPDPAVARRRQQVKQRVKAGETAQSIAAALGVKRGTIDADCRFLGIKPKPSAKGRPRKALPGQTLSERKAARAKEKVGEVLKVRDRRRFKTTNVPTGQPNRVVDKDLDGTVFRSRVQDVGDAPVLKDGAHNSKIGGDVLVGHLKGAKILTLTLEERATCPRSCQMWATCYGNSMDKSVRWKHGPALMEKLAIEVAQHCTDGRPVLIRTHILGDFYSVAYVKFWGDLLEINPELHVFGFTAWAPETEIGRVIAKLRWFNPKRFMVRHSGRTGPWGSFTIDFPTEQKTIGDAIVCPEQVDAMSGGDQKRHCGNCAVCWSCDNPIAFVMH